MAVRVKICGLRTPEAVDCAVAHGAAMVGFVFFPPSPRNLNPEEAGPLAARVPAGVRRVGLFVDPADDWIAAITARARLDILQLHGHETPQRLAEIRARFRLPVMKALPIAEEADLAAARACEPVADWLLFDAKAPKGATRPGGNALAFDWDLLRGTAWRKPWLLAGGLSADNLAEAVRVSGADFVDVSSGVEEAPGIKSPQGIRRFLELAASL